MDGSKHWTNMKTAKQDSPNQWHQAIYYGKGNASQIQEKFGWKKNIKH